MIDDFEYVKRYLLTLSSKNDVGNVNTRNDQTRVVRRASRRTSRKNFIFSLYRHSPCAILTAGILILMVAFAIFDSRHVTLFLEERTSAPDGKGVLLVS